MQLADTANILYMQIACPMSRGLQIFQNSSRSHLEILCDRRVTWSSFLTEDPWILGTTTVTLSPGLLHACYRHYTTQT